MKKIKFPLFITAIVFFVAVIVPLKLEALMIYMPPEMLDSLSTAWDEERDDYESSGLHASKPVIRQTPFNGMNIHGERVVTDNSFIITEKWVPYKPEKPYHYITIMLRATGYGEVSFELNGETKDFSIGHWTSEPIQKAENDIYKFRIEEQNNVINKSLSDYHSDQIQDTDVSVSATGKAITRSRRIMTYGSKQAALNAQASSSGGGIGFVIGKSSYWQWVAGLAREVNADPYNGRYSITINDTAWSQIYYDSIFTDGDQSTFVSGETVRFHLKTEGRYRSVTWYIRTPNDIKNDVSASYVETDYSYSLISNRGYIYTDFYCPGKTGTYEVTAVIRRIDGTVRRATYSIEVES